jgi:hypothetical protein
MAISELINLLELTRNLASRKSQLNKEYFENFIEPIWDAFIKVHDNYIKSMKEYYDLLSDESVKITTLINKIENDSLFTINLRAELYSLVENGSPPISKTNRVRFSDFTEKILRYLTYRNLYESTGENDYRAREEVAKKFPFMGIQHIRIPIVVYLLRKGDATNREDAQEMIRRITLELQLLHESVSNSYRKLQLQLFR